MSLSVYAGGCLYLHGKGASSRCATSQTATTAGLRSQADAFCRYCGHCCPPRMQQAHAEHVHARRRNWLAMLCLLRAQVGVSESIIMGIPMPTGTGLFKLRHNVGAVGELHQRSLPVFAY